VIGALSALFLMRSFFFFFDGCTEKKLSTFVLRCILATSKGNELNGLEIIGCASETICFGRSAQIADHRARTVCAPWPRGIDSEMLPIIHQFVD